MIVNKKIIFIGPINKGNIPVGGQVSKCQEVEHYLKDSKIHYSVIDTYQKPKVFLGLKVLVSTLKDRKSDILIALSSKSALYLAIFLWFTFSLKRTGYMVIGNWFPIFIKKNRFFFTLLNRFKFITTEGLSTQRELHECGLLNIHYHPNFKRKYFYNDIKPYELLNKKVVKILYLSRICKDKGVDIAVEAINKINSLNKFNFDVEIDIYGGIDPTYKSHFDALVTCSGYAHYCGEIDLKKSINYDFLVSKEYFCFVFPTSYIGEGFAGVFIDCMTIGVPIICTDWNLNNEIIKNFENGLIVDRDAASFGDGICWMLSNLEKRNQMANNQFILRQNFETNVVLKDMLKLFNI